MLEVESPSVRGVFVCPRCGSGDYNSDISVDPWIRSCRGKFHTGTIGKAKAYWYDGCDFKWPATDDHLYFKTEANDDGA